MILKVYAQRLTIGRKLKFCYGESKITAVNVEGLINTSVDIHRADITSPIGYTELSQFLAFGLACQRKFDEYWACLPDLKETKKSVYQMVRQEEGWSVSKIGEY